MIKQFKNVIVEFGRGEEILQKRIIRGLRILRLAKIPPLYHDYLSCIEGKGGMNPKYSATLFLQEGGSNSKKTNFEQFLKVFTVILW